MTTPGEPVPPLPLSTNNSQSRGCRAGCHQQILFLSAPVVVLLARMAAEVPLLMGKVCEENHNDCLVTRELYSLVGEDSFGRWVVEDMKETNKMWKIKAEEDVLGDQSFSSSSYFEGLI
ncbi:hypothetical protein J6590_091281 [Homalodisca vitripennis]|nr:hypothetical protein J6590_091281 [Homalodisca vitripennis]